nr:MAG TPA: hypothetical protein [Caudoviricetes sp.]
MLIHDDLKDNSNNIVKKTSFKTLKQRTKEVEYRYERPRNKRVDKQAKV